MSLFWIAVALASTLTAAQIISIALAWRNITRRGRLGASSPHPPVSVVRPLCGLDAFEAETLASTFTLDYPDYEVILCVAQPYDPVIGLARATMARFPDVKSRLIIGDENISDNPKLNNVVRGWEAAAHDWIILADSNVLMPKDYVGRLLAGFDDRTGLVCGCPIGSRPGNSAADLECAFLNSYEARWQYVADALGRGFAQGKTMCWRREILEAAGGIRALASEPAEDAAATKVVHGQGMKVRLVAGPFEQPLGARQLLAVWQRQLRWARLRRVTFPLFFIPELISTGLWPMLLAGSAAAMINAAIVPPVLLVAVLWYGAEILQCHAANWPLSPRIVAAMLLRDLLLPVLWVDAWLGNDFVWRGHAMSAVAAPNPHPHP